jgi:hypothetical protein
MVHQLHFFWTPLWCHEQVSWPIYDRNIFCVLVILGRNWKVECKIPNFLWCWMNCCIWQKSAKAAYTVETSFFIWSVAIWQNVSVVRVFNYPAQNLTFVGKVVESFVMCTLVVFCPRLSELEHKKNHCTVCVISLGFLYTA